MSNINCNGQLPYFYEDEHTWQEYSERLEQFLSINNFDEVKKLELLKDANRVLNQFPFNCDYFDWITKSFENLYGFLQDQNSELVDCSIIERRRQFYAAKQETNETEFEFLDRIVNLSAGCKFHSTFKDKMLDKWISGLSESSPLLQRFFQENHKLTFQQAIDIAKEIQEKDQLKD